MKLVSIFLLIVSIIYGLVMNHHDELLVNQNDPRPTITVTDYLGRQVTLPYPLRRVAVVNPYCAEMINAVGAGHTIVGVDSDIYENRDAYPFPITKDMIIGGHGEAQVNYERIIQLHPDVLILDSGFYIKKAETILGLFGIKVLVVHLDSAKLFYENTTLLGTIFDQNERANELKSFIASNESFVKNKLINVPPKSIYYEIRNPYRVTIPGEAFHEMLDVFNIHNIFEDSNSIWISQEAFILRNPTYFIRLSDKTERYSYTPPTKNQFETIYQGILSRKGIDLVDAIQQKNILLYSYYSHGGAGKYMGAFFLAKYLYPQELADFDPDAVYRHWITHFQGVKYIPHPTYSKQTGADYEPKTKTSAVH